LSFELCALLLKFSVFLPERVFEFFESFSLLFILLLPELLLAVNTIYLSLRVIIDFLSDSFEPLVMHQLNLFLLSCQVFILTIQEFDLLLEKGLLAA